MIFIIGISANNLERLDAEYPSIKTSLDSCNTGKECVALGKMVVHSKLFSVLGALKYISSRPFGTYYLLMAWNLRIFVYQKSFSKTFKKRFGYSSTGFWEKTKQKRPLVTLP